MKRICGHCGKEVEGNEKFCPACGRSLETEVAQKEVRKKAENRTPKPEKREEVKKKAKKKPVQAAPVKDTPRRRAGASKKGLPPVAVIFLVLALCICAVVLKNHVVPKPEKDKKGIVPDSLPQVKDVLTQHEAFHTASGDTYDEYWIVFFGNDTKTMKAITIQTKFDKSVGYAKEDLEGMAPDEVFPGISSISSMDYWVEEYDDSYDYILRIQKLDDAENLQKLHDCGVIQLNEPDSGKLLNAEQFMTMLEENGAEKVSLSEYEELHLCFKIDS